MKTIRLQFNERTITVGDNLTFTPGRSHVLSGHIEPAPGIADNYTVTLKKTLPEDAVAKLRARGPAGQPFAFDLGPLTAPPRFVFEAGALFRVGYQVEMTVIETVTRETVFHATWCQGLSPNPPVDRRTGDAVAAGEEQLIAGSYRRVPYNPKFGVESALDLRLDESVLLDPDDVSVRYRLNHGAAVESLTCRLAASDPAGAVFYERTVTAVREGDGMAQPIFVRNWPAGDYRFTLHPEVEGRVWREGPAFIYRRRERPRDAVLLSPLAPWTLTRDPTREPCTITDCRRLLRRGGALPAGWAFEQTETGYALTALDPAPESVCLTLHLDVGGLYAVFATPYAQGCLLQVGDDPLIRPIAGPESGPEVGRYDGLKTSGSVFVTVADLSRVPIRIFGFEDAPDTDAGLAALRLIPVTTESVTELRRIFDTLPVPLHGVNDWQCFFKAGRPLPSRLQRDQIDMIIAGQREIGIKTMDWGVGRSRVRYRSRLPDVDRERVGPPDIDPLDEALRCGRRDGVGIRAWLALMDYGSWTPGGDSRDLTSPLFRNHPECRRRFKNAPASDDGSASGGQLLSFFFPEVRRAKLDILLETAERGADGVLVGACRLPPVMCYHPAMVAAYRREFKTDPLTIDATQEEAYTHWITWRADFFSQLLRELRAGLQPIEEKQSRRISVAIRIPSADLYFNLAQGFDVSQWLREELIDRLHLVPLEQRGGDSFNSHDIRPYIALARRYGVSVVGGLGATWMRGVQALSVALRRVLGLLEAGVDGIELYESEILARCSRHRWMAPLFGDAGRLRYFLAESNIDACYPVSDKTCIYGYDNVSRWYLADSQPDQHYVWDLYGDGPNCL